MNDLAPRFEFRATRTAIENRALSLSPTLKQLVLDAELIADPTYDEVNHILNTLGPGVKRWHRGENDRAGFDTGRQIAELNDVQGGLAGDENELAAFFQMDIGGTVDEVLRCP
jgi:hypothetical protein